MLHGVLITVDAIPRGGCSSSCVTTSGTIREVVVVDGEDQPRSPSRIILADDHPLFRAALRQLLSAQPGLEVVAEAAEGREALELCRRLHPDLVVMDVMMPKMSGIEATRAIKRQLPTTVVLMLSAFENPEYLLEALRAGAAGYVLKHASSQQIAEAICQVLEGEYPLNHGAAVRLLRRLIEENKRTAPRGGRPSNKDEERREGPVLPETLSEREIEILRLMAKGESNEQIARRLWVSASTVKRSVRHIITALGASDRLQAILLAIDLGLLNNDL